MEEARKRKYDVSLFSRPTARGWKQKSELLHHDDREESARDFKLQELEEQLEEYQRKYLDEEDVAALGLWPPSGSSSSGPHRNRPGHVLEEEDDEGEEEVPDKTTSDLRALQVLAARLSQRGRSRR